MDEFCIDGEDARQKTASAVFAGLTPSASALHANALAAIEKRRRARQTAMTTLPILLASAMTVSMSMTGAVEAVATPKHPAAPKSELSPTARAAQAAARAATVSAQIAAAGAIPATYTVKSGDTVSAIAARYGLSTASVLAANGLGWRSLIFPRQVLKLVAGASTTPAVQSSNTYTIKRGDTISGIAERHGLTTKGLLELNNLQRSSIIYPGQIIRLVGSSIAITPVSNVTPAETPVEATDPPSPPPTNDPAPVVNSSYRIKRGDTVTSIAARFGVSISAVLNANGLTRSSIIYAGRTLTIPGVAVAQDGSSVTPLTAEMAANAQIIIQIGRSLGVNDRGIVIALAAAMQESSLRNVNYGDRDSVGVFQQRPSTGWGARADLLDVAHASRLFFGGPSNPNRGQTRGLLDISGWQSMTVTQAAQKVQISAYPNAYAKWEKSAWAWLAQLG